jgi:hypothetical protein
VFRQPAVVHQGPPADEARHQSLAPVAFLHGNPGIGPNPLPPDP